MKKLPVLVCGIGLFFGMIGVANALSVTVDGNVTGYVGNRTTLSGEFDIRPELVPTNMYNEPYDVVSGDMLFEFTDDTDNYTTTHSFTSWSGYDNNNYDEVFYRNEYTVNYNPGEEALLTVESTQYVGGTAYTETTTYTGSSTFISIDGHWVSFWSIPSFYVVDEVDTYITYQYDIDRGFTGDFTIQNSLNETQLAVGF